MKYSKVFSDLSYNWSNEISNLTNSGIINISTPKNVFRTTIKIIFYSLNSDWKFLKFD